MSYLYIFSPGQTGVLLRPYISPTLSIKALSCVSNQCSFSFKIEIHFLRNLLILTKCRRDGYTEIKLRTIPLEFENNFEATLQTSNSCTSRLDVCMCLVVETPIGAMLKY